VRTGGKVTPRCCDGAAEQEDGPLGAPLGPSLRRPKKRQTRGAPAPRCRRGGGGGEGGCGCVSRDRVRRTNAVERQMEAAESAVCATVVVHGQ
jgi:hypothetical protein